MLRDPPFNMQVVGMEKKRCRGPASNNQAWWVERITENKRKRIHAAGSGLSDLGMMQPEGRPQQSKLTT